MKKINFKSILCGFMAGVTTMYTFTVMAQQIQKKIDVSYRNIKIYADGKLVNTNGDNEAFIYNGTTYLPVRAVGEAFNKAVDWDGQTSSVYLGNRPTNSSQPTVLLEDLDYFTKTSDVKALESGGKDNMGITHSSGIEQDSGGMISGEIQYLLNGKYRKFSGIVGISYDDRDAFWDNTFKIYGDGKLLYSSPIFTGGVKPEAFNVDVTGVINLKIESTNVVQIYDAGFYA